VEVWKVSWIEGFGREEGEMEGIITRSLIGFENSITKG
jgi:hypothetical protein